MNLVDLDAESEDGDLELEVFFFLLTITLYCRAGRWKSLTSVPGSLVYCHQFHYQSISSSL